MVVMKVGVCVDGMWVGMDSGVCREASVAMVLVLVMCVLRPGCQAVS